MTWGIPKCPVVMFAVIFMYGSASSFAYGQTIPAQDLPTLQSHQDEVQRKNEIQRRLIEQKNKSGATRTPYVLPEQTVPALPDGQTCFQADVIELKGVTLLSEAERTEIVSPYLGKCIALGDVNNLLREITNLYTEKGYIAARGFVPSQDINDGTFVVQVIEGTVEGLNLHDEKGRKKWRLYTAFPFVIGKPLNLRDIEQGLDQMNRLKSNNAKLKLEPGSRQGATLVRIDNQTSKFWHVTTGIDNSGKKSTGVEQWSGTAELDDLIGLNDYLSFSWSKNVQKGAPARSQSLTGFGSVPLGSFTLSGSVSFYNYASRVHATTASYISSGYSRTHKAELDAVIHRNQDSKSHASVFLRRHTAASFIDDLKLDSSSYRLTSIGLNLKHEHRIAGGIFASNLIGEKGIHSLGSTKDESLTDPSTPRAQFHKVEFDLSFYKPFDAVGQKLSFTTATHGQWAPVSLYSADQISIGGQNSVRGFHENTLGGDTGAYMQNALAWNLPKTGAGFFDETFGSVSPFVAYDIGALRHDVKSDTEKGVLSGYAFGLKTSGGLMTLAATYTRPLRSPAHLTKTNHQLHASARIRF